MKLAIVSLLALSGLVFGSPLEKPANGKEMTFETRHYPQFDGLSLEQLKKLGAGPVTKTSNRKVRPIKSDDIYQRFDEFPLSFNVWEKWTQCEEVFKSVTAQGNCSASWAVAPASSITDRRCIASSTDVVPTSAWDLLTCCEECASVPGNGCEGGDAYDAILYSINTGIVTGGSWHSRVGCKSYGLSVSDPEPKITKCVQKCDMGYKNPYDSDKTYGIDLKVYQESNDGIMNEIQQNGPVVAEMDLYTDFINYRKGVYKHNTGTLLGKHYVKIVGWGVDSNRFPYWLAVNSWSKDWGDNGFVKIARGTNEVNIESNVMAVIIGRKTGVSGSTRND